MAPTSACGQGGKERSVAAAAVGKHRHNNREVTLRARVQLGAAASYTPTCWNSTRQGSSQGQEQPHTEPGACASPEGWPSGTGAALRAACSSSSSSGWNAPDLKGRWV